MSENIQDLSEPLNPSQRDKYELTPKELTEWILCTECYPKEKVYKTKKEDLSHDEMIQRNLEIAEAKRQPPAALLKLQ
jgi:hypothetical protein